MQVPARVPLLVRTPQRRLMDILIPDIAITEEVVRSVVVSILHRNIDREHMSLVELPGALRKEGIATMSEVRHAILEEVGRVSVIPRNILPA